MTNTTSRNKMSRTQYLASLRQTIKNMSTPKGASQQEDERYWKPEVDKAGTGSAVIRFLPACADEGLPFVQLFSHGFQGPTGNWFIENCPTTIENDCPACNANGELWKTGNEANKKLASSRKRKLNYVSNVLVVNDPKHPENNGKVFLYKYGKKIFEKIKDMIDPPPDFPDMQSVDPYDMVEGANFKLRITRQDGFPNYDKSSFDSPTPIGDDDRISTIESQLHSLEEIRKPNNFKSFDDLKKRFDKVVPSGTAASEADVPATADEKPPFDEDQPVVLKPKTKTAAARPRPTPQVEAPPTDDDDLNLLARLATEQ